MENFEQLKTVKFYSGVVTPLEMHKVRVVQKLNLLPIEERKESIFEAGFNTFLLKNKGVFIECDFAIENTDVPIKVKTNIHLTHDILLNIENK